MNTCDNDSINAISNCDNVIIISPYTINELSASFFGGTRLIFELRKNLEDSGKKVLLLSLEDGLSFTSILYRLAGHLRRKSTVSNTASESSRWMLNLIFVLFTDYLSRLDL